MKREILVRYLSPLAALLLFAPGAPAQTFPVKPIRLVVAFAPGGATDTFSRVTAAEMSKSLGQQVIVENRPGAGTTIAADFIAKSPLTGIRCYSPIYRRTRSRPRFT